MLTGRATAGIVGLAAVAAAAFGTGYYLSRSTAGTAPPPVTQVVVPDLRPAFSLADSAGVVRSISEWDGQALVINFWATWCPPCRREIPLLNRLRARHASQGFEVIGIAVDFREDVLRFLQTTPVDYPVLIGEQEGLDVVRSFGVESPGFPFTVFTDRQGRIVTVHVGELHAREADLILAAVAAVVAGDLSIEQARNRIRSGLKHGDHAAS